jgi:hypothetical protein
MQKPHKLRLLTPAPTSPVPVGDSESGIQTVAESFSFADALAVVRRSNHRASNLPATDEEIAEVDAVMARLGFEKVFEPQPIDYRGKASDLGMSTRELLQLLRVGR